MRGRRDRQNALFYAIDIDKLVPVNHPLRAIRKLADEELGRLSPLFEAAYSNTGRPSIPPEMIIKATLIQVLYTIRSERQLCEHLSYNMMYRWFVGLQPDAEVWDHSTFTRNRERFSESGLMQAFFDGTVARAISMDAAGSEHFSVDGTLIQSMASMKSFQPKDEDGNPPASGGDTNGWQDFRGEKRGNETHASVTDPEARLARKGKGREALLYHGLHGLMDNRCDILMAVEVSEANGFSERNCAVGMLDHVRKRHWLAPGTVGADAGYRAQEFQDRLAERGIEAHVAGDAGRTSDSGWLASQVSRRAIEKIFGWMKGVAGLRRSMVMGRWKLKLRALAGGAAYNLLRLANLVRAAGLQRKLVG